MYAAWETLHSYAKIPFKKFIFVLQNLMNVLYRLMAVNTTV